MFSMLELKKWALFIITSLTEVFFSWIAIHTVDELMYSISLSVTAESLFAFLLFIVEIAFSDKKQECQKDNLT